MAICGSRCMTRIYFWVKLPSICTENASLTVDSNDSYHLTIHLQDSSRQSSQTADIQPNIGMFCGEKKRQKHWNKTYSFLLPKAFSYFHLFLQPSENAGFFVKGGYKRKLFLESLDIQRINTSLSRNYFHGNLPRLFLYSVILTVYTWKTALRILPFLCQ